jgi:hypothetical protein
MEASSSKKGRVKGRSENKGGRSNRGAAGQQKLTLIF